VARSHCTSPLYRALDHGTVREASDKPDSFFYWNRRHLVDACAFVCGSFKNRFGILRFGRHAHLWRVAGALFALLLFRCGVALIAKSHHAEQAARRFITNNRVTRTLCFDPARQKTDGDDGREWLCHPTWQRVRFEREREIFRFNILVDQDVLETRTWRIIRFKRSRLLNIQRRQPADLVHTCEIPKTGARGPWINGRAQSCFVSKFTAC